LPAEVLKGDPFVMLTASKMNVVYVGIPNPLNLSSTGVDLNDLTLRASPPSYISQYEKEYTLNVSAVGIETVKVRHNGKLMNEFSFRAKRIPDPTAQLGGNSSGKMGVGEFKAQGGVIASLGNFDFDAKCKITGFAVTRNSLVGGRLTETNVGDSFDSKSSELIQMAIPQDIYTFTNVQAKCPGDKAGRTLNSLVFEII
jgi:hypothetical protein